MLSGRNNISSTANIQGYGSNAVGGLVPTGIGLSGLGGGGGGGNRRQQQQQQQQQQQHHLNSINNMNAVNAMMASVNNYSPHSIYSPQGPQTQQLPGDPYRSNGTASMNIDPFPATPYSPISALFMSSNIRNTLTMAPSLHPKREVTHVTSKTFSTYTTIYNIESEAKTSVLLPNIRMQVYQTNLRYTGNHILLRRIVNASLTNEDCKVVNSSLREFRHPNLVSLSNIIATDEFVMGSSDVIMEYRYISGAKSLHEAFFTENHRATEGLLWSFACQLLSLLRSFHETYVPLRGLHWSKIIYLETTGRFYFTGLGLMELLEPKSLTNNPFEIMKQDIQALGLIIFQLAAHNLNMTPENFNSKQRLPGFSISFWELIKVFLEGNTDSAHLCHALGERMSMEVGHQEGQCDYLLRQCSKEMHNGRLMRLMIKLNFVLESLSEVQEYNADNQRYALRLFSQFLFNQVDEQNRVHTDWGHVYHCLNKLDCGSEETIQLIGNDASTTVLVVSYADLRTMLENLFEHLQQMVHVNPELDVQNYGISSPGMLDQMY